jgi:hypothetical protein
MEDITESLKIIDNRVSNINGNSIFYSSSLKIMFTLDDAFREL